MGYVIYLIKIEQAALIQYLTGYITIIVMAELLHVYFGGRNMLIFIVIVFSAIV